MTHARSHPQARIPPEATIARKLALTLTMFFVALFAIPFFLLVHLRSLQKCESPDGLHEVELTFIDHLDRNYRVYVDGARVYSSPDFSPRHDLPYYEALKWDVSGDIVVFEVAHHRLFGYDVAAKRQLTDEQLLAVELAPEPPLDDYRFESEWPGIGRAHPVDKSGEN